MLDRERINYLDVEHPSNEEGKCFFPNTGKFLRILQKIPTCIPTCSIPKGEDTNLEYTTGRRYQLGTCILKEEPKPREPKVFDVIAKK